MRWLSLKKNKFRRIICVLAAAILTAAALTGCGTPKDCEGEGKITTIEKGVLKVGIHLDDGSMGYVEESTAKPAGFAPETAAKIAEKLGLTLEIIDTTEENLLNSLDADLYDCVITVGTTDWNQEHYSATKPYADVSGIQDKLGKKAAYPKLAIFGKKGTCLIPAIQNQALTPLIKDGTLTEISKKHFEKDIILK